MWLIAILGVTSHKKQAKLFDWTKITDKNCYVKSTYIIYDAHAKKGFEHKLTGIPNDTVSVTLNKKAMKLLQEFISDSTNFIDQTKVPNCPQDYFSKAFIIYEHNEIGGIINIGCNGEYWDFDPKIRTMQSGMISKKGQTIKNKLMMEFKIRD